MGEGTGREWMRAADADRERVVERLRTALEEGRLELPEFDERLQAAYAAKTYGELDLLLTDLPALAGPVVATSRRPTAEWLMHVWRSWVPTALVITVIWAIAGAGGFWPALVLGPWGLVLLWQTVSGLVTGAPRRMVEQRAAEAQAEQERRRQRQALDDDRIGRQIPTARPQRDDPPTGDTPDHG